MPQTKPWDRRDFLTCSAAFAAALSGRTGSTPEGRGSGRPQPPHSACPPTGATSSSTGTPFAYCSHASIVRPGQRRVGHFLQRMSAADALHPSAGRSPLPQPDLTDRRRGPDLESAPGGSQLGLVRCRMSRPGSAQRRDGGAQPVAVPLVSPESGSEARLPRARDLAQDKYETGLGSGPGGHRLEPQHLPLVPCQRRLLRPAELRRRSYLGSQRQDSHRALHGGLHSPGCGAASRWDGNNGHGRPPLEPHRLCSPIP